MEFIDPVKIWKLKDIVISNVSLVELVKEYGFELEVRSTGQFNYRMFCPFHKGKDGRRERTPSMFISNETNSFYCFSCSRGGGVIDFVSLIDGTPPAVVLTKLAKRIGLIDKDGQWDELKINSLGGVVIYEPVKTIEPLLFEIGALFRNYIKLFKNTEEFNKEFKWIEKVFQKVDEFLNGAGNEDYEYVQDIYEKVKKTIKGRIKVKK